jgi:hypothetical protein
MMQGLNLFARLHPLEVTQHVQRDEVLHVHDPTHAVPQAHPRPGALHGSEQVGENDPVGEAVHQGDQESRRIR